MIGGAVGASADSVAAERLPPGGKPRPRGDRLYSRPLGWGILLSALVHAAAFLLWRAPLPSPQAGEGASRLTAPEPVRAGSLIGVRLKVERLEIPPPPRSPVELEEPRVAYLAHRPVVAEPLLAAPESRSVGLGTLDGGAADRLGKRGASTGLVSPTPRAVFPEWDPPPAIRGTQVRVRILVDREGIPTGRIELLPPTADAAFNRRLLEKVRRMEFHAGRIDGVPVEAWAELVFVF
ncbi:MAG: hypothetical protein ACE5HP_01600 [Gemmatimonadota bacterium]